MDQEKIGKFIRDLRKKNNLTQAEFAEKYGVTYQAVSKWENGKNLPDMALIKQISKDFNIDIEDILNGQHIKKKNQTNNNKKIMTLLIGIIIVFILIIIFLIKCNPGDFEFKTLSSNCNNFNILGSISYNEKKSSIYISNIEYCGGNDNEEYKSIECTLYESHGNTDIKISSANYSNNKSIKLEEYLHDVTFSVDNYKRVCKDYSDNHLYLRINAVDLNDKTTSYNIPLTLEDDCSIKK